MAFDIAANGGYGDGSKGNLTVGNAQVVNAYASVSAISGKNITLGNISNSDDFAVGKELLIHVAGYKGTETNCKARGAWLVATIKSISGDTLTLNKNANGVLCGFNINQLYVQAVTLPAYQSVIINAGKTLTCPQFDATNGYGGVLALKCSVEFNLNGGHVDLLNKGLPAATYYDKGLVPVESNDDILRNSAGWENHRTLQHLAINFTNGACFIVAKKFSGHEDSRIGDSRCYGVARSVSTYPTGVSGRTDHIGGSSILIAAETIEDFSPKIIAKHGVGTLANLRGYGRCYIATESVLPTDEGLYAYDKISDPTRMSRVFNIKNFGDGSDGEKTNYAAQLNNYAAVTEIDSTRKIFTVASKTTDGLAKFKEGALVMVHATQKKYYRLAGRFILAKIVGINLNKITIDTALPNEGAFNTSNYYFQLVTVPQFSSFTLSGRNWKTLKFADGRGGICAIAVSDTCNLNGGELLTIGQGGAPAYGTTGLDYIGNAQMCDRLPIGQGNGSIFILANNLLMNTSTRLGATYTGNALGGIGKSVSAPSDTSLYRNYPYQRFEGGDIDVKASRGLKPDPLSGYTKNKANWEAQGTSGGGQVAGTTKANHNGGFGGNSSDGDNQGAHILIIANKITGFNIAAMSTGGTGGGKSSETSGTARRAGQSGGCGYGGAGGSVYMNVNADHLGGNGGWHGGGGGSGTSAHWASGGAAGGFAFVYCNQVVSQNTSGIILD